MNELRQALEDTRNELRRAMESGDVSEQRRGSSLLPLAEFAVQAFDHIFPPMPASNEHAPEDTTL